MANRPKKPLFLVGCPRSGTTLLQSLLAAHPEIASLPESKFFQYAIPSIRYPKPNPHSLRYQLGMISDILQPRLIEFFHDEINRPDLLSYFPKIPLIRLYSLQFIKIMNMIAEEQGKSVWLEKTPEHLYFLKEIEQLVPKVNIIHIIRNGADVIASLYEVTHKYPDKWDKAWDIDRCIERWKYSVEVSRRYWQKENHLVVKYETLVRSPEETLEALCEFIGLNYAQDMIENYAKASQKLTFEQGGRTVKFEIKTPHPKKFDTIFDESQRQYITEKIASVNLEFAS
ncbi:MAG: sulfotransferase [Cyanobacteria bacterium J06592_8]